MSLLDDKWFGFKVMAIAFAGAIGGQALISMTELQMLGRILTGIGILLFFVGMVLHGVSVVQAVSKKKSQGKGNSAPSN